MFLFFSISSKLLTYLDAACKIEEVLPAGVLYYNLIDPILKTERRIDKEQIEVIHDQNHLGNIINMIYGEINTFIL